MMARSLKVWVTASIAAGLIVGSTGGRLSPLYGAAEVPPITGIRCDRNEHSKYHVHAHLDIFIDGKPYVVPEGVGIVDRTCLYWLHTHDGSGIIHVEAPEPRYFTLDQFFLVWEATAKGAPALTQKPKIFVKGKKANGGLTQVEITDFSQIVVVYGKDPSKIPSSFDFPATYRKQAAPVKAQ